MTGPPQRHDFHLDRREAPSRFEPPVYRWACTCGKRGFWGPSKELSERLGWNHLATVDRTDGTGEAATY